jgi:ABC-2 type transport system permease protein
MFDLAIGETRRVVILTMRYPIELALALVLMLTLFYGIILGARALGADATPAAMASLAVGYAVWMLSVGPVVGIAGDIQAEAGGGTLENLFMSRYSLLQVLLVRAGVSFVHSLLFVAILLALITVVGRIDVHLNAAILVYVPILVIGATGLGLVLAGATLLLKRVQFLLIAVYAVLFPLAFTGPSTHATVEHGFPMALLPLAQVASGIKTVLVTGATLPAADLVGTISER